MDSPLDLYPDAAEQRAESAERRAAELQARRSHAAWELATSVVVLEALLAGRPVRLEMLDPWYRDRLPFWGGLLDDPTSLDVAVLSEQRHAGVDVEPAAPPRSPRVPVAPSLRDLGVEKIERVKRGR